MDKANSTISHSAADAALGFYYQAFAALLTLISRDTDSAAVGIEQLDDIELRVDGNRLLYQLKHSIKSPPPTLTIKSKELWRTIKLWTDLLPQLALSETTFHLLTVASIADGDPLSTLLADEADREDLLAAMSSEAQRVADARLAAAKEGKLPPYADRHAGCEAFLSLSETERLNLLRCIVIKPNSPVISEIESHVAAQLKILPPDQRPGVAKRLIEWWDLQVIYSLCGKRACFISRVELQEQISSVVADIEDDRILPDYETICPPKEYQPAGMLTRQINLVQGKDSDLSRAIREEWRAREQRSKWVNDNVSMATLIGEYDRVLQEHWSDRHTQMIEDCAKLAEGQKCDAGLRLLRWTHDQAPQNVRPITEGWCAPYYVRGSYQVLAINLTVGWHPDYLALLGDEK
jgi:hypothetical protein